MALCAVGSLLALQPAWAADENIDGIDDQAATMHRWGIRWGVHGLAALGAQLSDEQRGELLTQLDALKEAGKTNAEIAAALLVQLEGYGVTVTDQLKTKVTERAAARDLVEQMKAEGASRDQIKEALEAAGYDPSHGAPDKVAGDDWAGLIRGWGVHRSTAIAAQLTEDQRAELLNQLEALKGSDKTNAEIAAALLELLAADGVTLPDGFAASLSEGAAARDLVEQMRAADATRAEIKAALEAAGYDLGAMGPQGGRGHGGKGGHRGAPGGASSDAAASGD